MERTRRIAIAAVLGLAAAATGVGLAASPEPAPAQTPSPTLQVLKVRLSKPAVAGRDTSIEVTAVDPTAPVSGLVVQFGRKRDVFGSSACRAPNFDGRVPRPFRPGVRTRLSAPHRFRKRGKHKVLVRVDSGGCDSTVSSVYQKVTVTTTKPGQKPKPLIVAPQTLITPPGSVLPPILGGVGDRALPGVPGLPNLLPAGEARKHRGCKGSGRRLGKSRRARKLARHALLCLLNKTRRRHGLRRLRANRRLLRAAQKHSAAMVAQHFFAHVEPGGLSPLQRILNAGYPRGANGFVYGENIGFGEGPTSSPRSMMRAWMHSPPHRANILTRNFREVGLGVVRGIPGKSRVSGGTYTTEFGLRR